MRNFLRLIVFLPLGILLLLLALANRKPATLALDPFSPDSPALSFTLPLFVWLLAAVMLGVLIGGGVLWIGQGRHRKAARLHKREAEKLRKEAEAVRAGATRSGAPDTLPVAVGNPTLTPPGLSA